MEFFNFARTIPISSRPTYVRHLRFALVNTAAAQTSLEIGKYIARHDLHVSEQQMGVVFASLFLGMTLAIFTPLLIRGASKLHYIRVVMAATYVPVFFLGAMREFVLRGWVGNTWFFTVLLSISWLCLPMVVPALAAIMKANYPESYRSRIFAGIMMRQLLVICLCRYGVGQLLQHWPELYLLLTPAGALAVFWGLRQLSLVRVRDEPREIKPNTTEEADNGGLLRKWTAKAKVVVGLRFPAYPQATADGEELFSWRRAVRILRRDRAFLWYEAAFSLGGLANLIGTPLYFFYLTDVLRMSIYEYSTLTALPPLCMALAVGWWAKFFDRQQNPIRQRKILDVVWALPPLGYLLSAVTGGAVAPLLGAEIGRGSAMGGGQLNWHLGNLKFASAGEGADYSSIHLFFCGVRGIAGVILGTAFYKELYAKMPETFFFTAFGLVTIITLTASWWLARLERRYADRFQEPPVVGEETAGCSPT